MKIRSFIFFCLLFCSGFISAQTLSDPPEVYINNYKTPVTEKMYINCLKIDDLTTIIYLTEQMNDYDIFKLELHRFGKDTDIVAAFRTFVPSSKEFQKKYAVKNGIRLRILAEEDEFGGSDLEVNTKIFPANSTTNMAFCKSHDLKQCSFYLVIKGYKKTGAKTQFGEDVYDNGTVLSPKSVVFTSWESKTK
ncbi:MAG: hypothetical protein JWP12_2492 [Bacteroidetes bacterium]|nr:hypothetical protein [Bacteroidota bacterium]